MLLLPLEQPWPCLRRAAFNITSRVRTRFGHDCRGLSVIRAFKVVPAAAKSMTSFSSTEKFSKMNGRSWAEKISPNWFNGHVHQTTDNILNYYSLKLYEISFLSCPSSRCFLFLHRSYPYASNTPASRKMNYNRIFKRK